MTNLLSRITINDKVCNGKPTIRNIRISVQTIVEFLFAGTSEEEILHQYPALEKENIEACKQYAIKVLNRSFIKEFQLSNNKS